VPKIVINNTIVLFFKVALSTLVVSNHNSFRVLFNKIASVGLYFIWKVYIYILAVKMASPGNQHCANCIGTLSFPVAILFAEWADCFKLFQQTWSSLLFCLLGIQYFDEAVLRALGCCAGGNIIASSTLSCATVGGYCSAASLACNGLPVARRGNIKASREHRSETSVIA